MTDLPRILAERLAVEPLSLVVWRDPTTTFLRTNSQFAQSRVILRKAI
jgi:hypothetical protein